MIALFLSLREPALLLGDLNSNADDPQIRRLLATPGVTDAVGTILGRKDPKPNDWIISRGLRCLAAEIHDSNASDHAALRVELE